MSISYQDINDRLLVIERKVAFILDAIPVKRREENGVVTQHSLGDLYYELQLSGSELVLAEPEQKVII